MTIFEYIRLSSEDDDLKEGEKPESNSIANQRNLINTYIQSHEEFAGADVVEFCDDGWSGKSFERPAVNVGTGAFGESPVHHCQRYIALRP